MWQWSKLRVPGWVAMPKAFSNSLINSPVNDDMRVIADVETRHVPITNRKSILFVMKSGEFGGAEKHLLELVSRLGGSGVQVSILCLEEDFYTDRLNQQQSTYVRVVSKRNLNSFWGWFRTFRGLRPEVVVLVNASLWCLRWYTPVAAWLAGIPRRFSIAHLTPPPVPAKVEGWSVRSILRRLRRRGHLMTVRLSASFDDAIICVGNAIRDRLVKDYRYPANKTVTIYNGVCLSHFDRHNGSEPALKARLARNPDELLLVSTARLSEQKRLDILLSAMARLLQDGVRCNCVIVGDGPLRTQLSDQAAALGLSGRVFFEGFQKDVRPYLQIADAFVLTSHREGFPLSILEAMACGLPCVVTDVGGNAEAVTHNVHGLVVPPGSVDKVAEAISYLATHPSERAEMSRMARLRVREEFDINDRMAEISKLILS